MRPSAVLLNDDGGHHGTVGSWRCGPGQHLGHGLHPAEVIAPQEIGQGLERRAVLGLVGREMPDRVDGALGDRLDRRQRLVPVAGGREKLDGEHLADRGLVPTAGGKAVGPAGHAQPAPAPADPLLDPGEVLIAEGIARDVAQDDRIEGEPSPTGFREIHAIAHWCEPTSRNRRPPRRASPPCTRRPGPPSALAGGVSRPRGPRCRRRSRR